VVPLFLDLDILEMEILVGIDEDVLDVFQNFN
jgi:hypothetical protein